MKRRAALERLSDAQLVTIARQQHPHNYDAYEVLMGRYEKKLFVFCRNVCGCDADAKDALQNVLVKALQNIHAFRKNDAISSWLYKIAYHESVSVIRKRKSKEQSLASATEEYYDEEYESDRENNFSRLMALLNAADRDVVVLRLVAEFEFKEIQEITGGSLSAVKMRFHRALEKLKPYIDTL